MWINGLYYNTFKGNTFTPNGNGCVYGGSQTDYDAVISIDLRSQSLTTDFTNKFLSKFRQLRALLISFNSITNIDISENTNLTTFQFNTNPLVNLDTSNNPILVSASAQSCLLSSADLSNNTLLTFLNYSRNNLPSIDLSNNPYLSEIRLDRNNLTNIDLSNNPLLTAIRLELNELDNLVNSQVLIDLDNHGKLNSYLQSSIFGGGVLTAAGLAAKASLQSKGWTIVGI